MPFYEYRCPAGHVTPRRRSYGERELLVPCGECGVVAQVVFSPTSNILIPIHFQQVREGGALGGGAISWSDVHDVSERELAHLKDHHGREIHIEKAERAYSRPGRGTQRRHAHGSPRIPGVEAGREAAAG